RATPISKHTARRNQRTGREVNRGVDQEPRGPGLNPPTVCARSLRLARLRPPRRAATRAPVRSNVCGDGRGFRTMGIVAKEKRGDSERRPDSQQLIRQWTLLRLLADAAQPYSVKQLAE